MHTCSVCLKPCSCGGDLDTVVISLAERPGCACCGGDLDTVVISLAERPGCACCLNQCEHGIAIEALCLKCETADDPEPEEDAEAAVRHQGAIAC